MIHLLKYCMLLFNYIAVIFFYIFVHIFLTHSYSYSGWNEVFFTYVFIYLFLMVNHIMGKYCSLQTVYPFMHISRSVNVKIQYLMFPLLYISNVKHLCFWNIKPSYIRIIIVTESAYVIYILYHMLLVFFLFVRGYGGEVPFTKCQPGVKFSCSRKGPQLLFHVTSPTIYCKQSKTQKWNVQKQWLWTDILVS